MKSLCYGGGDPTAAACSLVNRISGTGQEDVTSVSIKNEATIWTSGLDFELDDSWNFSDLGLDAVPGRLQINWLLSYLFKYDTRASNVPGFNQVYHWAGTLGPNLNGIDPGSALKYKMNTTFSYMEGPFSLSLNWRFYPHTHNASYPLYLVQPGGLGACDVTVSCNLDTPAYHIFDLSATYTFMRNYVLRAGIDNLFNKQPPAAPTTGIHGNCTTPNASGYCPGGSLASDGYGGFGGPSNVYDTLGRRFYIGINAKF